MFDKLSHLTIQTGHTVDVPRPAPEAVTALRPFVADNGGDLGDVVDELRGVRIRTCARPWRGAVSWDVSRAGAPIALCVLCVSTDESAQAWGAIESVYLRLSDQAPDMYAPGALPQRPSVFPWLVTLLIMPGAALNMDVMPWLADFDQCFAYAVMEALNVR